jgi:hypothetical protein
VSPANPASPDPGPDPPTTLGFVESRAPSGLFPSPPPRPTFREPHPVRIGPLLTGAGVAAAWLLLIGLMATSARAYIWFTLAAATVAWACALVLVRFGDRGAAAGVALSTAVGVGVATGLVVQQWATTGWPLW